MKFTFIQTIKAKTFIIGTLVTILVMGVMIALANFLPGLLADSPDFIYDEHGNIVGEAFKIERVIVFDNSGLDIDFAFLETLGIKYEDGAAGEIAQSKHMNMVTESENEAVVLAVIERGESGFVIRISRPESTELIKNADCFALLSVLESALNNANLVHLGIAPEDVHLANAYVHSTVNVGGEAPRSEIGGVITVLLTYLVSIALFMLIFGYGQMTAQTIATEKSSRVMELLLTSIQPLAVVIGKVLASTLVVLMTLVAVGGVSAIVFFATAPYGAIGEITGAVETTDPNMLAISAEIETMFSGFSALNLLLIFVVFMLGFLFFALISALIGASVSKIEDLQTASQPIGLIASLGLYMAIIPPLSGIESGERNTFMTVSYYLPISSPFALPSAILTGTISGGEVFVSIAALALCLVGFAVFVAKVYEHIILHNGDRIKVKDMIAIAGRKR
jgi:ABC-2 type transport system permease protein